MAASPVAPPALLTLEELAALPNADAPMQLVQGEVVPRPLAEGPEATVTADVLARLTECVAQHRLGRGFGPNTGFALFGAAATCRSPDVAFIRADKLPARMPRGPIRVVPDLVVEVLSPNRGRLTPGAPPG